MREGSVHRLVVYIRGGLTKGILPRRMLRKKGISEEETTASLGKNGQESVGHLGRLTSRPGLRVW